MSLTNKLISAISSGFYVNEVGVKVSYKDMLIELFTYAKMSGYNKALRSINIKYKYVDRRYNEIQTRINLKIEEMTNSSYDTKYNMYLSFIQSNADADSVNMPIFNTTNIVLSEAFTSLKDLYHELSVLSYKRELFMTMMTNLTKNKNNLDTIISEINSI